MDLEGVDSRGMAFTNMLKESKKDFSFSQKELNTICSVSRHRHAAKDGTQEIRRVEGRIGRSTPNTMLVLMTLVTSDVERIDHKRRVRHPFGRLLRR